MHLAGLAVNQLQIYIKTGSSLVGTQSIPLGLEENIDRTRLVSTEKDLRHIELRESLRAFDDGLALSLHLGLDAAAVVTAKNELALVFVGVLVDGAGSQLHGHGAGRGSGQLHRNLSHFSDFGRSNTTGLPRLITITALSKAQLGRNMDGADRSVHGQRWGHAARGELRCTRKADVDLFLCGRRKTKEGVDVDDIEIGVFL